MPDRRPEECAANAPITGATRWGPINREHAEEVVKWAAVLLGCSIPVSTAADNVLFAFILLCWIAGGGYRAKWAAVRRNPVALAALALFALHLIGTLYTIGAVRDVVEALVKSLRLLLIPALILLLREARWRERGLAAFLGSMIVTLVLSYLLWLGVLPASAWLPGSQVDPVAFKGHITHNVLMAFAAFLFAQAALIAKTRRGRLALAALCVAAAANVLLMVPGRTGVVVLLVLFTYFLYRQLRATGVMLALVALSALAATVLVSPDTMLHKRIALAEDEYQQWRSGERPQSTSSVGLRLEFLRHTLEVIHDHPVLGVGTGGFAKAYADRAGEGEALTRNPHNEFLLFTVQFGIAGFALLAGIFGTQWWAAARLSSRFEQGAARALVLTMVVASALSSTLIDHTEGVFFAYMSGLLFASYGDKSAWRRVDRGTRRRRGTPPIQYVTGESPAPKSP